RLYVGWKPESGWIESRRHYSRIDGLLRYLLQSHTGRQYRYLSHFRSHVAKQIGKLYRPERSARLQARFPLNEAGRRACDLLSVRAFISRRPIAPSRIGRFGVPAAGLNLDRPAAAPRDAPPSSREIRVVHGRSVETFIHSLSGYAKELARIA